MFLNHLLLLLTAADVFAKGDAPPEILREPSLLRLLDKHRSGIRSPRTYWSNGSDEGNQNYRLREDAYGSASEGISHNYASYPSASKSSIVRNVPQQIAEYWSPSSSLKWNANYTNFKPYGYSRGTQTPSGSGFAEASYESAKRDSIEGSHSTFQYQQLRPASSAHFSIKQSPSYYAKSQIQINGLEASGKPKYNKKGPNFHYGPPNYKKTVYPRIQKPYVMQKYPTKKIVHPFYRKYYQSPFQQYVISSGDAMRYGAKKPIGYSGPYGYPKASEYAAGATTPTLATERYHTTERMDESYPDHAAASADYAVYNDTYSGTAPNFYETYEEVEHSTSEPEEISDDENATTRGYYGDRIYMSTQNPILQTSSKAMIKNKYYIVRKTSEDDDIETVFE